jgi:putative DNA primase/helicase
MSADIRTALEERGVFLRGWQPGEHRAPCPQCGRGKRDDALAVKLEPDGGATWTCHRCGWKGGIGPCGSEHPYRPTHRRQERRAEPERYVALSEKGQTLWRSCRVIEPGTVAATYLENRRCIIPPGDLRWHPALAYYIKDRREPVHVGPALVALVTDVETAEPISLHRTWIAPDGTGKADLDNPRRLLWKHRSDGVIRLWPDEEVTLGLTIGEGIETCLAAAREGLTPVWATISAGNLAEFPVLPGIEGLTVLVDHDKPNPKTGRRAGIEAARAVIQHYAAAGFDPRGDIKVIFPPSDGQDAADLEAA